MYNIFKTEKFVKKFDKLDNNIKLRFEKQFRILETNPFIGKPLKSKWFRELKVDKYRVYFLIKEQKVSLLLIDLSDKKGQQESIDFIYSRIKIYLESI